MRNAMKRQAKSASKILSDKCREFWLCKRKVNSQAALFKAHRKAALIFRNERNICSCLVLMWMTTPQIARREKVTSQTVRRWVEGGRYERFERTPGGHFRIWVPVDPEIVLYARVSSVKQRSSLDTQQRRLHEQYPGAGIVRDTGSGFNFKRPGFLALLERALRGEPVRVVATTSDRVTRSGFPLIRHIFELSGGSIELLEEDDHAEQFDVKYLVAYITSFCNSQHGKRAGQRHKKNSGLPEE